MSAAAGADLRRHGAAKGAAGILLGFAIAIGASGIFALAGPGQLDAYARFDVVIWLVPPGWTAVFIASFLFSSGWRAWAWLGAAALATHLLLVACHAWL